MIHFTDEQMQAFLDHTLSPLEEKQLANHLQNCTQCQRMRTFYERLYRVLSDGAGIELSEHFAETVVAQVAEKKAAAVRETLMTLFLMSFGLIAVLVISSYFVDLGSIFKKMEVSFPFVNLKDAMGWWPFVSENLRELASSHSVALFVGPALLLLALVDHYLLRPRFKLAGR